MSLRSGRRQARLEARKAKGSGKQPDNSKLAAAASKTKKPAKAKGDDFIDSDGDDDDNVDGNGGGSGKKKLPRGFVDEDIDDDEAFNSEDERLFGELFASKPQSAKQKAKAKAAKTAPKAGKSSKNGKGAAALSLNEDSSDDGRIEDSDGNIEYSDEDIPTMDLDQMIESDDEDAKKPAAAKPASKKDAASAAKRAADAKAAAAAVAPAKKAAAKKLPTPSESEVSDSEADSEADDEDDSAADADADADSDADDEDEDAEYDEDEDGDEDEDEDEAEADDEGSDSDTEVPDLDLLLATADGTTDQSALSAAQRKTQSEFLSMLAGLEAQDKKVEALKQEKLHGVGRRAGELVSLSAQRGEFLEEDALGTVPAMKPAAVKTFDDGLGGGDSDDDDGGAALFASMGVDITDGKAGSAAAVAAAAATKAGKKLASDKAKAKAAEKGKAGAGATSKEDAEAAASGKLSVSALLATLSQAAGTGRTRTRADRGDAMNDDNDDDDAFDEDADADDDDLRGASGSKLAAAAETIAKQLRKLNRSDAVKTLAAPLTDVQQEALERAIAHDATAEEVSRWDAVVQKNRESTRLVFSQSKPKKRFTTSASLQASFNPVSDLERDLESVMQTYGLSETAMRARERETLAENMITEDETLERQAKMRRMRAVMFYHEEKLKQAAKIKSKRTRKLRRKENERKQLSIEELEEIDPAMAEIERLKQEMNRAKERATLAHATKSQWARRQLARSSDGAKIARKAIADQIAISRELRAKMAQLGAKDGDDDDAAADAAAADGDRRADSELSSDEEAARDERRFASLQREYGVDASQGNAMDDGEQPMSDRAPRRPTVGSALQATVTAADGSKVKGVMALAFMQRAADKQRATTKAMLESMNDGDGDGDADDADAIAFGEDKDGAAAARQQKRAADESASNSAASATGNARRTVGAASSAQNEAGAAQALLDDKRRAAAAAEEAVPVMIARGALTGAAAAAAAAAAKADAVATLTGKRAGQALTTVNGGKGVATFTGSLFDVDVDDFGTGDGAAATAKGTAPTRADGKSAAAAGLASALAQLSSQEQRRRVDEKDQQNLAEQRLRDELEREEREAAAAVGLKTRSQKAGEDDVNVEELVLSDDDAAISDDDQGKSVEPAKRKAGPKSQHALSVAPRSATATVAAGANADKNSKKPDAASGDIELSDDDGDNGDAGAGAWGRNSASEARGGRAAPVKDRLTQGAPLGDKGAAVLNQKAAAAAAIAAGKVAATASVGLPGAVGALAEAGDVVLDTSTSLIVKPRLVLQGDVDDERFDGEDEGAGVDLLDQAEQAKIVAMAFSAGADELAEFEKSKKAGIEANLPQVDPLAGGLPGWGAWGGAGKIKVNAKRARKEAELRAKAQADVEARRAAILGARSDLNLKGVEINQDKHKAVDKYKIAVIPSAYASREQYDAAMRMPLGADWQTNSMHRLMVRPAVSTKAGEIIAPLRWTKGMAAEHQGKLAAQGKVGVAKERKRTAHSANITLEGGKKIARGGPV